MLISPERRFVFIHVPRTGGSSIRAALRAFVPESLYVLFNWHVRASDGIDTLYNWQQYFSFAFVRNPWDLQSSMYRYILTRGPAHPEWAAISRFPTLNDYLDRYIRPKWEHGEMPIQSDFLTASNGTQAVSFIGKFERLQCDFDEICHRIGLEPRLLERHNASDGPLSYSQSYDENGKKLIAQMYAADIDRFKYTF